MNGTDEAGARLVLFRLVAALAAAGSALRIDGVDPAEAEAIEADAQALRLRIIRARQAVRPAQGRAA